MVVKRETKGRITSLWGALKKTHPDAPGFCAGWTHEESQVLGRGDASFELRAPKWCKSASKETNEELPAFTGALPCSLQGFKLGAPYRIGFVYRFAWVK